MLKKKQTQQSFLRHTLYMLNEEQIIKQAKSGDLQAFQELVEYYSHRIYSAAFRILNHKEHAEDCVQEVFIKIYHKIGSFNEQSKFSTWLYSVAVNTAIDLQRKHARHSQHESPDLDQLEASDRNTPENVAWLANVSHTTQRALMQLSDDVRIAFVLRHHEERSIEEISQILDVNPNTVKNRIFRAVARLREILQPKVGDYETVE
ncbi:RNA polymerase sigma factor [Aliikangiella coralliicola]|uniref:Sigma-70 family RNA polymerase sigma factor n=1 Tax=Aliikangiella coralliicola TaxID=2592383 RepID=A0A545UIS1_9GAMM|nr:sigma-70 family RNA polymerase sigma factor [Aliikangiella coralliicola]TQV89357.1 sigma-70 family RNA polymerase sigma factor [Aliikangiella coralliicola]